MEQQVQFNNASNRFHYALLAAIKDFRSGNDRKGLDEFLAAMEDLEMLLETNLFLGGESIKTKRSLPILEEISVQIKNKDVVGLTDLLEFTLYPIVKELAEENGNDDSKSK